MKSEFQEQITNIVLNWVENNYYPERYREYSIDISYHFSRGRPDIVIDEWFDKGKHESCGLEYGRGNLQKVWFWV